MSEENKQPLEEEEARAPQQETAPEAAEEDLAAAIWTEDAMGLTFRRSGDDDWFLRVLPQPEDWLESHPSDDQILLKSAVREIPVDDKRQIHSKLQMVSAIYRLHAISQERSAIFQRTIFRVRKPIIRKSSYFAGRPAEKNLFLPHSE